MSQNDRRIAVQRRGVRRRVAMWTLWLGVVLAPMLVPQEAQVRPAQRLRSRVESVLVDVYPTRDGRAVSDLAAGDFELLEDGVPQRIELVERVAVRLPGAPAERGEVTTVGASNEAAADPRSRLFVVYLDTYHTPQDRRPDGRQLTKQTANVDVQGGNAPAASAGLVSNALSGLLSRLIGPDDLVGLYTPEMPVGAITFTRGTRSVDDFLRKAPWQRLGAAEYDLEPRERMWRGCYPKREQDWMVFEMIARRRQAAALDGLRNLVTHVQGLREGRTAILLVSTGWNLYRRNERLAAPVDGRVPGQSGITVSQSGKPAIGGTNPDEQVSACDQDRQMLADLDLARDFKLILQDANRANVTFYPIDPAGPRAITGGAAGWAINAGQPETLKTMATATDGIAIVDTTDLDGRLRRIVDDLSSYYLIGYTPTNTRHDGKFREITVRVKREGVAVRARSGYRALTEAEAAPRAEAVVAPDAAAAARTNALAALGRTTPVLPALAIGVECGSGAIGVYRQGPYTGRGYQPTTDPRFRRAERLRLDVPSAGGCSVAVRLLDRRGQALPVPFAVAPAESSGVAVTRAELALVPLAQADYLVEVAIRRGDDEKKHLVAIRIVP
jgi:VWFA-related protein